MSAVMASLPAPAMAAPHAIIVPPESNPNGGGTSKLFVHPFLPLLHLMHLPHLYLHRPFHRPLGGFGHHPFGHFPFRAAGGENQTNPSGSGPESGAQSAASGHPAPTKGSTPLQPSPPNLPFTSLITPTGQVVPVPGQLRPVLTDGILPYPVSHYGSSAQHPSKFSASHNPYAAMGGPQDLNLLATSSGTFIAPMFTQGNGVIHFGPAAPPPASVSDHSEAANFVVSPTGTVVGPTLSSGVGVIHVSASTAPATTQLPCDCPAPATAAPVVVKAPTVTVVTQEAPVDKDNTPAMTRIEQDHTVTSVTSPNPAGVGDVGPLASPPVAKDERPLREKPAREDAPEQEPVQSDVPDLVTGTSELPIGDELPADRKEERDEPTNVSNDSRVLDLSADSGNSDEASTAGYDTTTLVT